MLFVRYCFIMILILGKEANTVGELIAVLSGKGGTGKTSLCAGIASALALQGERVLCIDCDVGLRNLDIALGMSDVAALSFQDVCSGNYSLSQAAVHPTYSQLHFLTAPMNCTAEQVDIDAFGAMLKQAQEQFDYVFMDAPAGIEAGFTLAARFAHRIFLVTGPDPAAIRDAARAAQMLELMGKDQIRLIVNRISKKMAKAMKLTIDDIMDNAGLPLLGVVPEDPNVTLAAAFKKDILRYRRKDAAKACCRIARRIQGYSTPIFL